MNNKERLGTAINLILQATSIIRSVKDDVDEESKRLHKILIADGVNDRPEKMSELIDLTEAKTILRDVINIDIVTKIAQAQVRV